MTLIILSIVLVSIMIAIMKNVQRISARAEEATSNIADVATAIGSRLAPLAASGLVAAAVRWFKKGK